MALKKIAKSTHHVRPKKSHLDDELAVIYGENRDNLQVIDRASGFAVRMLPRIFWASLLLFFGALFWGIIAARSLFSTNDPGLLVSFSAPSEVKSGEEVTLEVQYRNPTARPLADLALDVNLPPGFVLREAHPAPTNPEEFIWRIGGFGASSDGVIALKGTFFAPPEMPLSLQTVATYRPANFNADFSAIASTTIHVKGSVLTLLGEGPTEAVPGTPATYTWKIKNGGVVSLTPKIVFALPIGFTLQSSDPVIEPGAAAEMTLAPLAALEEKTISITGLYTADAADVVSVEAEAWILLPQGSEVTQVKSPIATNVAQGDVRVSIVANGSSTETAVSPGDALRISLRIENTGAAPVSGVSGLLDFQSEGALPITWAQAVLDGASVTKDGVAFSAGLIGSIGPGEKKTFNLSFPLALKEGVVVDDAFSVVARVTTGSLVLPTAPLQVRLNASMTSKVDARYYSPEGAIVGSGPWPPKVDKATDFAFTWSTKADLHEVEDVVFSAPLPPGVSFEGATGEVTGQISEDASSRTLTWRVARIAPGETFSVRFTLRATPGPEDVDDFLKLLGSTLIKGTDTVTGARLERTLAAITSELPDDLLSLGKGVVEE